MKEKFQDWNPSAATRVRLDQIVKVLKEYAAMDIRLTLRQLYYRLVSSDIIPNQQKEYKKLGTVLANARLAGLVDWEAIEDRVRHPDRHSQWENIPSLVRSAIAAYRRPRWEDQSNYVELWCEKDALRSVLDPITDDLHVTLMVNRGYSSISAMYDSAKRMIHAAEDGKDCHILYLGDFDPSGEDMVRDVRDRMGVLDASGVRVRKIALTQEQIDEFKPPPNPAKQTDSRYQGFANKHGDQSFEVDALPPKSLMEIVRDSIEGLMDMEAYRAWESKEEAEKAKLVKAAKLIV